MKIRSRYSEIPQVVIEAKNIPGKFHHLIPLAKEWSISDDVELEAYIAAASEEKKRELVEAFNPHFDGLWDWHQECDGLIPQPDEIVLFDIAANAAATVHAGLPKPPNVSPQDSFPMKKPWWKLW